MEREGRAPVTLDKVRWLLSRAYPLVGHLPVFKVTLQKIDPRSAIWSLPADKMKMRRPYRVPLLRQVLAKLEKLYGLTGRGRYLFPSSRSPRQPMSENTMDAALRRLGYSQSEMNAHGFRAMAATLLNEMAS